MKEYRKNIRVDLKCDVNVKTNNDDFKGILEDISVCGIGFWSENKINQDEDVEVKFKVNEDEVKIKGKCVFRYKKDNMYRYGVKFMDIESKYTLIINRYIRKEIVLFLSQSEV